MDDLTIRRRCQSLKSTLMKRLELTTTSLTQRETVGIERRDERREGSEEPNGVLVEAGVLRTVLSTSRLAIWTSGLGKRTRTKRSCTLVQTGGLEARCPLNGEAGPVAGFCTKEVRRLWRVLSRWTQAQLSWCTVKGDVVCCCLSVRSLSTLVGPVSSSEWSNAKTKPTANHQAGTQSELSSSFGLEVFTVFFWRFLQIVLEKLLPLPGWWIGVPTL